jgi:hypothetical protein
MQKLSKLKRLGILGDVRQALGADSEHDESKDKKIISSSNEDIIGLYSQWHLGDKYWGKDFISKFKALEKEDSK